MTDTIEVGIIGLGFMGKTHLKVLKEIENAKVTAIMDINEKIARKIAEENKIPKYYTNFNDMIEKSKVDAIIIATPPNTHAKYAIESLKSGKHILLEKPMATNLKEAMEIYREARNKSQIFMIGYSLRFHSIYIKTHQLMKEILGEPVSMWHAAFGRIPSTPWIGNKQISGGMINENGVHILYIFHWYGKPIREVYASTLTTNSKVTIEDNAAIILKHEDNSISTFIQSWSSTHPWRRWGFTCRNGTITIDGYLEGKITYSTKNMKNEIKIPIEIYEMYLKEDKHFIQCLIKDQKPIVNEEDGLKIQKIVDAIYKSAIQGKPVKIS